jgi:hypothetical protein
VLLVALGFLLLLAVAVTPKRSPAKAVTAGDHGVARGSASTSAGTSASAGTSTSTSTSGGAGATAGTNPPATVNGAVTRPDAGGNCGLSLQGQLSDPRGPRTTVPAPVGQCTVLEIGDSLGNDLGFGLSRHIAPTAGLKLIQLDKADTGLSKTSYYDWPTELASDLNQYHPQLVIVCLGGNDEQGMDVNGSAVKFQTPQWKSLYVGRVKQLASEATARGAYVLWVGLPIMQQPSYNQGVLSLNSLYQEGVAAEPNATFVSTWSLFTNLQGQYQSSATVNGSKTALRDLDGIHLSYAGEDVIATYVIRQMATIYHVQLVPTDPSVVTSWS